MAQLTITPEPVLTADDFIEALDVAPEGNRVVAASVSGEVIHATRTQQGSWAPTVLTRYNSEATRVQFSPDGNWVAAGGNDGVVEIFDASHTPVATMKTKGWCRALAWRPDSQELAAAIGREVHRFSHSDRPNLVHTDHPTTVECLAWTHDGKHLGVGTYGGVWWYQGAVQPLRRFEWTGALLSLSVSPDGNWAVSGNQDSSVHCWRLWRKGDELEMTGYPTKVQHLAWDPDGLQLAVGNMGEVTVWPFSGKGPKGTVPLQFGDHERHIVGLAYRPTVTNTLATVSADGLLCVWENPSRETTSPTTTLKFDEEPTALRWKPDGDSILIATASGNVFEVGYVAT